MVKKTEIQVFVSSPKDVAKEKNIVETICKDLTESIENYCKISFRVKEWSSIVGQFGVNTQQQITNKIGNYDIYLGIWWMRFGSKTGNINNHTGEEFESGTHEEFVQAYDRYTENKFPSIYLFFKNFRKNKMSKSQF